MEEHSYPRGCPVAYHVLRYLQHCLDPKSPAAHLVHVDGLQPLPEREDDGVVLVLRLALADDDAAPAVLVVRQPHAVHLYGYGMGQCVSAITITTNTRRGVLLSTLSQQYYHTRWAWNKKEGPHATT